MKNIYSKKPRGFAPDLFGIVKVAIPHGYLTELRELAARCGTTLELALQQCAMDLVALQQMRASGGFVFTTRPNKMTYDHVIDFMKKNPKGFTEAELMILDRDIMIARDLIAGAISDGLIIGDIVKVDDLYLPAQPHKARKKFKTVAGKRVSKGKRRNNKKGWRYGD